MVFWLMLPIWAARYAAGFFLSVAYVVLVNPVGAAVAIVVTVVVWWLGWLPSIRGWL